MRSIIIFCLSIISITCFSQKQGNIWYFGNNAGLDFNSGTPVPLLDGKISEPPFQNHIEGTSCISDSSGSLLFYSDGMTVWNKAHEVMLNGSGLLGNFSSTQSSIIVPSPSEPDRYFYLFTVGSGFCCGGNITDGLRYSLIDMCLDNGLGGIVSTTKNIKLTDTICEKIAVIRHDNGTDYWILTHKFYSNEFIAYQLSETGIINTVISAIGSVHGGGIAGVQGQLKFSPSGNKIAIAASNGLDLLELFDFDNSTGIVSNYMPLYNPNNNSAAVYGVEFSPNGTKLYATGMITSGTVSVFLVQYDLSSNVLSEINNSMYEIYNLSNNVAISGRGLQLGPDNKIYRISISINNHRQYLSSINEPDSLAEKCNYVEQSTYLGGKLASTSLPGFIAGYDYSNATNNCDITGISRSENKFSVYPNPFSESTQISLSDELIGSSITFVNSIGQIVHKTDNVLKNNTLLNRNNLPNGIYFLVLSKKNEIIFKKSVIIN